MALQNLKIKFTIILSTITFLTFGQTKTVSQNLNLTQYVDPFIGSGGHGHVFVGASVPFGGVQVGPSNFNQGWDWSSSYFYSDNLVKGFSHLNLSGTGCADLGELCVMPTIGKRKIWAGNKNHPKSAYGSLISKKTEAVKPGYYSVMLKDYNIKVELAASERVGFHKYTFPKATESRVIIDLSEGNSDVAIETYIRQINDTLFEGYRFSKGWASDEREYFALELSKPVKNFVIYNQDSKVDGSEAKGQFIKGFLEFSTNEQEVILLKMGVSPVSMENALKNIRAEIPHWNFDKVVAAADVKWNNELLKVKIETDDLAQKRIFYTALYHTMIAPNLYNDSNGEYRGTDKKIYPNPGFNNYTLFSLWDTYRALHPLLTITQPNRVTDIVNSMLLVFKQQGKLPVWHLRGNETETMTGYSAVPVIVDVCLKGFEGIDLEEAYNAVKTTAMGDFEPGVKDLMELGYIPADHGPESVASAMEYAISDWAISKLAEKLGKKEDAEYFAKRAKGYQEYFDPITKFMRGKLKDGSWRTPFDPISAQHRVNDYCEGNAWQYLWMVPQDPEGLINLLGGDESFVSKLDTLFSLSSKLDKGASIDISGLIGQYAHGNEPSHHIAYLYAYAGEQFKTADKVDTILNTLYQDQPDGLSGNEDCGQMSAWYILSSMGFYPVNPSAGIYVFGRPLFKEVSISLPNNQVFKIETENNSLENKYIQSVTLNGNPYSKSFISHKDLNKGGFIKFVMGSSPNLEFGKNKADRPESKVY